MGGKMLYKRQLVWEGWPCYLLTTINGQRQTKQIEPSHDKTNKVAYAPIEDSDQPGHPPSLISVFSVRSVDQSFLHADCEDSDQTGRMTRLNWVFAGLK